MAEIGEAVRVALAAVLEPPARSTKRQLDYLTSPRTGVGTGRHRTIAARLAGVLKVQSPTVTRWLKGKAVPSRANAEKIERAFRRVWMINNRSRIERQLMRSLVRVRGTIDRHDDRPNPRGFDVAGSDVIWPNLINAYRDGASTEDLAEVFTEDVVYEAFGVTPSQGIDYGDDMEITIVTT